MKLTPETIEILKNFSTINQSLMVNKGNILRTVSPTKATFAKAEIDQEFENTFAIYDLSNFLGVISMFQDPILDFENSSKNYVSVISGDEKINSGNTDYYFAEPENIIKPPDKDLKIPQASVQFKLNKNVISTVMKAVGLLNLPEVLFVGDGEKLAIQAVDSKRNTNNKYNNVIGKTNRKFSAYAKVENLKLLNYDYDVGIVFAQNNSPGVAHFTAGNLNYWVVLEVNSSFS